MKKYLLVGLTTLGSLMMFSCNEAGEGSSETDDTLVNTTTPDSTSVTANATFDEATVTFIKKAASGGMMEVQLGQLAQNQAQNQRVKDFGAMMVRDHSKANQELKSIASTGNASVPDSLMSDHKDHVEDMEKKKGNTFDRDYMKMMVEDHEKDVNEFEKASNSLPDGEVKAFATRTLPVLRAHLDSAKSIRDGLKK